ncbi:MAG TPA: LrgB family protein, partial [Acinetobacter sp.]|nr:LrgB family protein [Acinetobacter sp.]
MLMIVYGFIITFISYLAAKPLNKKLPQVPVIVFATFIVIGLLSILGVPYQK